MYGYSYVREAKEKKKGYEELIKILDTLEEQVIYRKSTMSEAFQKVNKNEGKKYTYEQSKEEMLDCYRPLFSEEEKQHLNGIIKCFEAQNAERTKELLEREKRYFQDQYKKHEEKYKDQEKAVIGVSLLMGLFLCIALW